MPMNKIIIRTYPRLHLSLMGMNNEGYRINGGAGFSITSPQLTLTFIPSFESRIIDQRVVPILDAERNRWVRIIDDCRIKNFFTTGIQCWVTGPVLPHMGLGSDTMIYLSSIEALFLINGAQYKQEDIVFWSRRGGASGVGINTYFTGGYVFDVGVKNRQQGIMPSSQQELPHEIPLLFKSLEVPRWKLGVCFPAKELIRTEMEELMFFKKQVGRIDADDVSRSLYEIVFGITSSIIEYDYKVFCQSINKLQETKWKKAESAQYGEAVFQIEKFLLNSGADCVGMSSFGPAIYYFSENAEELSQNLCQSTYCAESLVCYLNNKPRELMYD